MPRPYRDEGEACLAPTDRRDKGATMTLQATRPITRSIGAPSRTAGANDHVKKWVEECAQLCKPDKIVWCDGSREEKDRLIAQGVEEGTFIKLNQEKLPGCYLHRSNQNDVAR